jgi:hypothetical protein
VAVKCRVMRTTLCLATVGEFHTATLEGAYSGVPIEFFLVGFGSGWCRPSRLDRQCRHLERRHYRETRSRDNPAWMQRSLPKWKRERKAGLPTGLEPR